MNRNGRSSRYVGSRHPAFWISTFGGVGTLPGAPGTWGSLATLPFAWMIATSWGSLWLILAALLATLAGLWASGHYLRNEGGKDPAPVVIDEVAGQLLTLAAVPADPFWYAAGFALFRLFDVFKPWPVSWADRSLEGPAGIMLDDIIAGLYAFCALTLIQSLMDKLP